jgi:hypothetical protein
MMKVQAIFKVSHVFGFLLFFFDPITVVVRKVFLTSKIWYASSHTRVCIKPVEFDSMDIVFRNRPYGFCSSGHPPGTFAPRYSLQRSSYRWWGCRWGSCLRTQNSCGFEYHYHNSWIPPGHRELWHLWYVFSNVGLLFHILTNGSETTEGVYQASGYADLDSNSHMWYADP